MNSTILLNQAVANFLPNLKEAWSFFTVKESLEQPSLQEFITWLQQKAEARDRMQTVQSQPSLSPIYSKQPSQLLQQPKIKFTKSFLSSTKEKQESSDYQQILCPMCSGAHLLYRCSNFCNQTPSERIRFAVEKKTVLLMSTRNAFISPMPYKILVSKTRRQKSPKCFASWGRTRVLKVNII